MSRKLSLFVFAVVALFVALSTASADPAKTGTGRLADGRAFRMDPNGYRIIDELAELEVTVSELERQNNALEDEADDKQKVIEQLRQGKCAAAAIVESDIAARRAATNLPAPAAISCAAATDPLEHRIADLESKLAAQTDSIKFKDTTARFGEQQTTTLKTQVDSLRSEADALRVQVAQAPSLETVEQLAVKNKDLETKVSDLQEQLASAEAKSTELAANVDQLRSAASSRAALTTQQPTSAVLAEVQKTSVAPSRQERGATIGDGAGNAEAKREFKATLSKIDSKISERKRLLDSVQGKKLGVTLTVQPLRTADGRSLDSIRLAISSLTDDSDAGAVRSGLSQIDKILDDDLALFHRLGRI